MAGKTLPGTDKPTGTKAMTKDTGQRIRTAQRGEPRLKVPSASPLIDPFAAAAWNAARRAGK